MIFFCMQAFASERKPYVPPEGYVPDEKTAIKIAKAVLIPIFGEAKIKKERPFKATLIDGTWTVEGTLPKGLKGGVAHIEISKEDARIIYLSHGK